ncbi:hypothetical protein [Vreelandella hamiltonii]|nr:hypothetical protein [Halomonas hamiltonii]
MHTSILTYKNARLTPEERWLLMQWASVIGADQSFDGTLKDLFMSLGMTYAQGRRAWGCLIKKHGERQNQFIEIERLPVKGPGRPAVRYRLSAKFVKELQKYPLSSTHHVEEIATLTKTTLLSAENKNKDLVRDGRRRRSRLTLPNRWLLMVLLAHADTPGVITSLGISTIRHLTGMSRSRIDRQLKKLVDLGIVAHHEPGRYSHQAKKRKTSIYLLDLAHPSFGKHTRTPITIVSPPSSTKPEVTESTKGEIKRTELVGGIVDAVMTAGVCSLQIEALLKEYNANKGSDSTVSDDTKDESKREHDPYREAKKYQERYNEIKMVFDLALSMLPSTRYLEGGVEELLKRYDVEDANWLLTSVHIDTCRLLTSSWNELKEGCSGPEQPQHDVIVATARRLGITPEYVIETKPEQESEWASEKADNYTKALDDKPPTVEPITEQFSYHPLALLFYALSHHLAKQLQRDIIRNGHGDDEAMTYMLVPVFPNSPNGSTLPAFQLRSYGLRSEDAGKEPTTTISRSPVSEDLKTYWQTHHQDCLSAINDESDDATESDAQEPSDA